MGLALYSRLIGWLLFALGSVNLLIHPCLAQNLSSNYATFFNNYFNHQLAEQNVPGAAVSLVVDGQEVFSQGFGLADVERNIPVDPKTTLFRLGSTSKLVTATAVMQVSEQGIDLNTDINQYLPFQIEETYPQPVTLAHLLTHTDGFDSGWGIDSLTTDPSALTSLETYLRTRLPPRILPPGEVVLYSDVGLTLAGYLVEAISQSPFPTYVKENILEPLEMEHSSFEQPLPTEIANDLATGYQYRGGQLQRRPVALTRSVPAGGFAASASDMAHFMSAHLQQGAYKDSRLLRGATIEKMHNRQFYPHPLMEGFAYGFYERFFGNLRLLEHSGRYDGFASLLLLIPDRSAGLFIAANSSSAGRLVFQAAQQFLETFYPSDVSIREPIQSSTDLASLEGVYWYNRYAHGSIEKLAALLGDAPQVQISTSEKGLQVSSRQDIWQEVEPLLFQSASGTYLTIEEKPIGTYLFIGNDASGAYRRTRWYEPLTVQAAVVLTCCSIFLSSFAAILFTKRQKIALLAALFSLLNLTFLIGLGATVFLSDFWDFFYGLPSILRALLYFPPISIAVLAGLFFLLGREAFRSFKLVQIYYLVFTVAAAVFLIDLNYWNLLGIQVY